MKIFLDCGYYAGKALDYYAPLMDDKWVVHAFEPNPLLTVDTSRFSFSVNMHRDAVWVKNGQVRFTTQERHDAAYINKSRGSTAQAVLVPCIDFSQFVAELPEEATIVCSMDIEGAEFEVLRKMIKDGTAQRISLLDIEFHHRLSSKHTPEDANELIRTLQSLGVLIKLKIPVE